MFQRIDLFGSKINLRFQGQQSYQSNIGSIVSLIIIGLILLRLTQIILSVVLGEKPQIIYSERQVNDPDIFYATSETFPMAFAMENPYNNEYYIDEGIYNIKAQWKQKQLIFNQTTQQNDILWKQQDLKIQPCTSENFKNPNNMNYYLSLNYTSMYCLSPEDVLAIQGDFQSKSFSYIELQVQKCQKNCKSADQLDEYLLKSNFGLQLSDAFVDPQEKEYPFKIYSRDMFWPTSNLMPKDVNIYIRNNYVYSDFGWFGSDIITQRFPSFSFYEDTVYPPNFKDYFISIIFRFEKQKESVYNRSYKNFMGILSDIGGFSQSLMTIGFLITYKVSQLYLNQSIINQIFNYEESSDETQTNQNVGNDLKKSSFISQKKTSMLPQSVQFASRSKKINFCQTDSNVQLNLKKVSESNLTLKQESEKCHNQIDTSKFNIQKQRTESNNTSRIRFGSGQIKKNQSDKNLPKKKYKNKHFQSLHTIRTILEDNDEKQTRDDKQTLNKLLHEDLEKEPISNALNPTNLGISKSSYQKLFIQKQKNQLKIQKVVEKQFEKLMKKETNSMKMSVFEYFVSLIFPCGRLRKKKQVIDYSIEKLYQNLDIFSILKRLIEVEKLKRLLLDQNQIKLLDYLPKPTINLNLALNKDLNRSNQKNQEINLLYQDNRSELQKAKDAFEAYKNILSKDDFSELDQKLIDMLDQNLIQIFEAQNQNYSNTNPNTQQQQQNQQIIDFTIFQSPSLINEQQIMQFSSNIKEPQNIEFDINNFNQDESKIFEQQNLQITKHQQLQQNENKQTKLNQNQIQEDYMQESSNTVQQEIPQEIQNNILPKQNLYERRKFK
ncbi:small GTP-binding domain protein (macronuclear) [Tetrahymena thermophila SB210]|uniref:Small GTP-binding domain protein n=1 Tax=Tetrahymena thermophila (strain SB210) TaxID=312017 RepID=I7M7H6_TETTS|nr:small GTP-binding domain protein [Tetrahymena thermophila SB210]EAR93742.1 small GTP-binding domain protein [Tetrahymena thermophila SB210]|eukprot:XP_001013987.1 small GTP-binding domain protein [Tetrahymena thermophila SB210]